MTSVEVIPSEELSFEELHQVQHMFASEGIPVRISSECIVWGGAAVPPLALDLVIAGMVGGFFGAIGMDIWQKLKVILPKIISYLRQKRREPFLDIGLVLRRGRESLVFVEIPTEGDIDLGSALEKLPRHLKRSKARQQWVRFDTNRGLWESLNIEPPRGFPSSYCLRGKPTIQQAGTFISVFHASWLFGLSQNLIRCLARKGVIDGIKMRGQWFVRSESVESYARKNRKLGPKGPQKT